MESIEKYPNLGLAQVKLEEIFEQPGKPFVYAKPTNRCVRIWRRHRPFGVFMIAMCGALGFSFAFWSSGRVEKVPRHADGITAEPRAPVKTVIVGEGDTLYSIAQRAYGRSARFEFLYQANRDTLKSPRALATGQEIKVP